MPEFNTNKCILKIKWVCPNPNCDTWDHKETQVASAFSVKIVRKQQVVDVQCDFCRASVRLELN